MMWARLAARRIPLCALAVLVWRLPNDGVPYISDRDTEENNGWFGGEEEAEGAEELL